MNGKELSGEKATWGSALVGLVMLVVGLVLLVWVPVRTVSELVESRQLQASGDSTTGTVVMGGCGRGNRKVTVSFDVGPDHHFFTQRGDCDRPGSKVEVFYDADDPDRAYSPEAAPHPALSIFLALLAAVFGLIIGASGLVRLPLRRGESGATD